MASSIFGVSYADIVQVYLSYTAVDIDSGSFSDDGGSPPTLFMATQGGSNTLTGLYADITFVAAT